MIAFTIALKLGTERMDQTTIDQLRITHIGGPTALIEIGQLRFLTDPTFEPAEYQYVAGLLSHDQHGDNLDPAGRAYLSQAKQTLTTPVAAQRLGGNASGMSTWETVSLRDASGLEVRVTAMPARHGPEEIKEASGPVTGWMLEWEGQRRGALYISGDTVLFEGVEEIVRRYRIAVALLNCGAARAQRLGPAPLTFTAAEAVRFAKLAGEAIIVPIHYEGWSHFSEGRAEIEQAFAAAGLERRLRFLPFGQSVAFNEM